MHRPETTPRHSVFFDYEIYPFRRPAEMEGKGERHRVVIVGAGLIGLGIALDLARFGIRSVILESEAQVSHGSRALALTRRTSEILSQIGVVEPFMDHGMAWTHGDSYYRGRKVYEMVMPRSDDDGFPPALNLAQQYMEKYLVDYAEASGLIDLRWQSKVIAAMQGSDGVHLTVDTPEGEYGLDAEWAIAADGGRSEMRRQLGLRLEGNSYAGNFVILDIKADLGLPPRRQCHYDPEWNPGNNLLIHRQPEGMWRLDYKLPEGETAEQALEPERIADRVEKIMAMIGRKVDWELDWATVYTANTLTLPDYRCGHVLFAGDAAHLLPIFGVRGANTGFQDENNLAWKLAYVIEGRAPLALLDTYSHERVKAAREICEEGGKSTRFMTPQTAGQRLMRDAVLSLSLSEGFVSDLMNWRTSRPHTYYDSPLNSGTFGVFEGGPDCGEVVRDARLGGGRFLLGGLSDPGFHLFVFVGETPDPAVKALLNGAAELPLPPVRVVIGADPSTGYAGLADHLVADRDGRAASRYDAEPGTVYLFRPDMHVCARWREPGLAGVSAAIETALGKGLGKGPGRTEDA